MAPKARVAIRDGAGTFDAAGRFGRAFPIRDGSVARFRHSGPERLGREDRLGAAFVVGVAIGRWTIGTSDVEPIARLAEPVPEPTLAERLAKLESEGDSIRVDWAPNGDGDISGFVVWNDRLQKGYMAFDRLAPNDPAVEQYQLWIFDATRDDERPVDGGVFDVDLAGAEQVDGRTVVEVDAKLPIGHAKMFALTIERPGGVVVSGRERLPGLAVAP